MYVVMIVENSLTESKFIPKKLPNALIRRPVSEVLAGRPGLLTGVFYYIN